MRIAGYRFFFSSNAREEPQRIHIEQAERYAIFWLEPIGLAVNVGFRSAECSALHAIVNEHRLLFVGKWNEYFGDEG